MYGPFSGGKGRRLSIDWLACLLTNTLFGLVVGKYGGKGDPYFVIIIYLGRLLHSPRYVLI